MPLISGVIFKVPDSMPHDLLDLTGLLEHTIRTSIKNVGLWDWDEDHITRSLLTRLRSELGRIELLGDDVRSNIHWQAYKLSGTYENRFGDVAILVNIHYKDGEHLEGAAFLEAKRRQRRKTTFDAMRAQQLNKLLKHAPRAHYLLYDYEDITGFQSSPVFFDEVRHFYRRNWPAGSVAPRTSAVCVPLNVAKATGYKDTLLYRYATPLSVMLSCRFFQGLDLEFGSEALQVAAGFLEKFGLPSYILEVEISEAGAEPTKKTDYVNRQRYEPMD
ncbi:hypothetical protein [Halomonas sp. YLB-10]|uniref:hypothetical protein n=1 Tax=Halomonas sp. YLB-10 TaxID=2483111 RepID=UPI00163A0C4B|nr:hypothetical protein [Halomonas sp. YLB-10]